MFKLHDYYYGFYISIILYHHLYLFGFSYTFLFLHHSELYNLKNKKSTIPNGNITAIKRLVFVL